MSKFKSTASTHLLLLSQSCKDFLPLSVLSRRNRSEWVLQLFSSDREAGAFS